ncbi:MAG TPA: HD-GYP domain-containing protein [Dissulfurispiraceae bacterium]|nr:HD-GYP domain-containing protein [Dissulfurispiraceae bacterium]
MNDKSVEMKEKIAGYFKVDKDLIIVFLLVAIIGFVFFFVSNQRAFLNFFYLPVIAGAFFFGKRYATLSATASVLIVVLMSLIYSDKFLEVAHDPISKWLDIGTWGGFLVITGYCIGHLYEKKERAMEEIKRTYRGIVEMLSLIIDSVDKDTQSHSNRVSTIAVMIARAMKCPEQEVENIRAAALLHDLGKLGVSNEVLQKIGALTEEEKELIKTHTTRGAEIIKPVGGKVVQILPYIIYHHEQFDGTGYHKLVGDGIPLGARIIAVADVYDALMSDRPYRKGVSPAEAREHIVINSNKYFDPTVVDAFVSIVPQVESLALHRL